MKFTYSKLLTIALLPALFAACGGNAEPENESESSNTEIKEAVDYHSYANVQDVYTKHMDLDIGVDFEERIISGKATFTIDVINGDKMVLDTKTMDIQKVTVNEDEAETTFNKAEEDPMLGAALTVDLPENTQKVNVYFSTRPEAAALQWLNPQQTAGKVHPFLFTQGETILTRSWVPCQDTPSKRFTYTAKVTVPEELMVVMSASNPKENNKKGVYEFEMTNPIPAYLMALAVGDLEFREIGPRTGVYSEPGEVEKAQYEFADMEEMVKTAEQLYGPYKWERFDVIVLPPSFPYGGMENPRLTFATPTVIAGDRSLTTLIAHELSHSWSGNLVTNATWEDFWLNEGFTVYFERRIMEEMYGKDYVNMLAMLGMQDLRDEVADMGNDGEYTRLKTDLKDKDPEDAFSDIPYEKGYAFLLLLEQKAGRDKFDEFVATYFKTHEFQTMTSDKFVAYLKKELLEKNSIEVNVDEWVYQTGLPANCPNVESDRFTKVEASIASFIAGETKAADLATAEWSTHEWRHFLRNLPKDITVDQMTELDAAFNFTNSGNSEILAAWFENSINNNYAVAYPKLEEFLINVGRRKFLAPLYQALSETEDGMEFALQVYAKARPNYHYVSTQTIDQMLKWEKA